MRQATDAEAIPATWTMRQIAQVRSLWTSAEVDDEMLTRWPDEARASVATELARALVHEARSFVVEVHLDDCDVTEVGPGDRMFTRKFSCRWQPKTKVVQFVGGQADGKVVEFERIRDRLRVPVSVGLFAEASLYDTSPTALAPRDHIAEYDLSGWSEQGRHWVYSLGS